MRSIITLVLLVLPLTTMANALDCYQTALSKLSVSTAAKICKQAESLAPIECYKSAVDKLGPSVAVSICSQTKSVQGPISCYEELQSSLGASIASKLCKASEDTAETRSCYEKALGLGLGGQSPGFSMGYTNAAEICTP
jgi:hypothetical protein